MDVACVHTCTRSHSSWSKLKVLVTKGVLGSARGLTSSDASICCQVIVLILMVDETDPARGLIRSWWRIRNWWCWWWSTSAVFYCTVVLWRITFDVLVWQFHHTTTTIRLSVVTVVEFASRWQMVFYTGSASHVVLSARMSVSLRSSMHIKIDMAFLVVLRLVHPICFFSSFLFTLFSHLCACLWPDKERCTCLKEFLNLSFPVRKAGGSDLSISTAHGFFFFFFWRLFVVIVLFLYELKKRTRPASSYGHVESLHV